MYKVLSFKIRRHLCKGSIISENAWLPPFFIIDSNSTCKDLLFLHGPNLAQKPLYLVGTVLNSHNDTSNDC